MTGLRRTIFNGLRSAPTFLAQIRYWSALSRFKEADVMALYLTSQYIRRRAGCRSNAVAGIS